MKHLILSVSLCALSGSTLAARRGLAPANPDAQPMTRRPPIHLRFAKLAMNPHSPIQSITNSLRLPEPSGILSFTKMTALCRFRHSFG
jgi:hypothetical protein